MSTFLLSCLCGPLLRGNEESDLYGVLEVSKDASGSEIRRRYLQKSLRMHPDKLAQRGVTVTKEHREEFQQLQMAYETLRDPEKRRTYDRVGLLGLKIAEDPMSAHQELFTNFLRADTGSRCRVLNVILLIAACILLFPVLACLKLDGSLDAKWVEIGAPVWLYLALGLAYHVQMVFFVKIEKPEEIPDEEWEDPLPMGERLRSAAHFACNAALCVLLALKLDGDLDGVPYGIALLPLFLGIALKLADAARASCAALPEEPDDGDIAQQMRFEDAAKRKASGSWEAVVQAFKVVQLLVLALRFDGVVGGSYWALATPTFAYMAVVFLCRVVLPQCEAVALVDPEVSNEDGLLDDSTEEERQMKAAELMATSRASCFNCCCLMILVVLALCRIEVSAFSTFLVLLPILIPFGCFVCMISLSVLTVTEEAMHEAMVETHGGVPADVESPEQPLTQDDPDRQSYGAVADGGEAAAEAPQAPLPAPAPVEAPTAADADLD